MVTSHTAIEHCDPEQASKMMRDVTGPHAVDQFIRQAISTCWMMLPQEQKTVESVEREIRRLVDRALSNLKEDMAAFGIPAAQDAARKPKRGRRA